MVTLPPYGIAIVLPTMAFSWAWQSASSSAFLLAFIALGVCLLLIVVLDIVLMPFFPIVNGVTYGQLRQLQEVIDLQLVGANRATQSEQS